MHTFNGLAFFFPSKLVYTHICILHFLISHLVVCNLAFTQKEIKCDMALRSACQDGLLTCQHVDIDMKGMVVKTPGS